MLIVFSTTLFISSCKKDEIGTPPDLPPQDAFDMGDNKMPENTKALLDSKSYINFGVSAPQVAAWTVISSVIMSIPTAVYVEALKQEPQHHSGTTWLWEYSVTVLFTKYTVQLYGTKDDTEVTWEMKISAGEMQEFTWYTGKHNINATEGQWIIYGYEKNCEILQIDWTRNNENNTGTIKYTNIEPEGNENGGYIYFGNDQSGEYDAFYKIYVKSLEHSTEIEWDSEFYNGRIKAQHSIFFQDEVWHCWGTDFQDMDCDGTGGN